VKQIDVARLFVNRVDEPILRAASDAKKIGAIGRAGEGEIAPRQRRFVEITRNDVIEPLDLLDREILVVAAKVDGKFSDLVKGDRIGADAKSHAGSGLAASVSLEQMRFEGFGVAVDGLTGPRPRFRVLKRLEQISPLLI
jgi:hypothetical protein